MDLLAHILSWLTRNPFSTIAGLVILGVMVPVFLSTTSFSRNRGGCGCLSLVLAALSFVSIFVFAFLGSWIANGMIHARGVPGRGVITGQSPTNDVYNDQPVIAFDVMIRRQDGSVVRTTSRTDSFNVYPSANQVRYPGVGVEFNVRHLPDHPEDFVILADDDSHYARGLRCTDRLQAVATAERERSFAPNDAVAVQAREAALAAARADGCIAG